MCVNRDFDANVDFLGDQGIQKWKLTVFFWVTGKLNVVINVIDVMSNAFHCVVINLYERVVNIVIAVPKC